MSRRRQRDASKLETWLHREGLCYNLLAMQIESDYQIRDSSPFSSLSEFLDETLASFAAAAPVDRHLVIKLHPLDSGLERWFSKCRKLIQKHRLSNRVHVIRGGTLGKLIARSCGVVVVNSTVGLHALRAGIPVLARGTAMYDIPGLTHRKNQDLFWTSPSQVNMRILDEFLRALTVIQVKGSFFHPEGSAAAAREMATRLLR
jgi:capsular polysaccharide export protein